MRMQTRSMNKVPIASSSSESEESVEMDAPRGTSTGTGKGEVGSRSRGQDDAGESGGRSHANVDVDRDEGIDSLVEDHSRANTDVGHRSRSADVGNISSSVQDDAVEHGSRNDAVEETSSMGPPASVYEDGSNRETDFHQSSPDLLGFESPRRFSRAQTTRSPSPKLNPAQFFGDWVQLDLMDADEPLVTGSRDSKPMIWAESTDADGLGDIPLAWMKTEPVSPKLAWTPPVSDSINIDFDSFWSRIGQNFTAEQKETLMRRSEKMKDVKMKPAGSVSETTGPRSPKKVPVNDNGLFTARGSQPSRTAVSTPRIPAAAKGKGRAPQGETEHVIRIEHISEDELEADEARLRQIEADALLAMRLQNELPHIPDSFPPGPRFENTPRQAGTSKAHAAQAEERQIHRDRILAEQLHNAEFEEAKQARQARRGTGNVPEQPETQTRTVKRESRGREGDDAKQRKSQKAQTHSRDLLEHTPKPYLKATDQFPADSILHKATHRRRHETPPSSSDDSDSSSSSSDIPSIFRGTFGPGRKKHRKRKSKKVSKKPKRDPSPSDSSSGKSSRSSSSRSWDSDSFDSDWEAFIPPSEADSNASERTKRQKKRDKQNYL
ncbi:hypothetical protein MIND_01129500 [Mycena indigotica]|uniref:Uncharacterized protein n=1 Tax=Mycena indigotica TaxID=2126181 RepID=A0A8H6S740_9AGAR|nr:uncharacterized protein MIND_01129500 [Mycena indigotica]KAF7293513.1 hypothetical protein MIND_01129500 [Mycena indigotica]